MKVLCKASKSAYLHASVYQGYTVPKKRGRRMGKISGQNLRPRLHSFGQLRGFLGNRTHDNVPGHSSIQERHKEVRKAGIFGEPSNPCFMALMGSGRHERGPVALEERLYKLKRGMRVPARTIVQARLASKRGGDGSCPGRLRPPVNEYPTRLMALNWSSYTV